MVDLAKELGEMGRDLQLRSSEPIFACRHQSRDQLPFGKIIITRRFFLRPSSVELSAIG